MLSAALGGEVAGQNRSDAGFIAAERPSSWGKDGGKTPGCHFALDPPPFYRPPGSRAASSPRAFTRAEVTSVALQNKVVNVY